MTIRYTAILVIFLAGVAAAYRFRNRYSKSVAAEEEIIRLIEYIRNKIMYFSEPIEDIYSSFECSVLSETGFTEEIYENGWRAGIALLKEKSVITDRFASAVSDFGDRLGTTFSEEEINNCNYYISRANDAFEKDKLELPKKSKLYSSFSITGAMLIAIILF